MLAARVRLLGRIIYWLAVLAVSVALLVVLIRFFESRDDSDIGTRTPDGGKAAIPAQREGHAALSIARM
jgi:hypothetical protein